ncbi:MAG: YraN family protein [Patescibacteria group bacterium]
MGLFLKKDNITQKRKTGNLGEELAKKYLKKQGYKIIKQNYNSRVGEIDLIAREKDQIIFIEVKTRTNHNFGYPEESVDSRKQNKIRMAAQNYLVKEKIFSENYRFDVVSVEINQLTQKANIKHIPDAF